MAHRIGLHHDFNGAQYQISLVLHYCKNVGNLQRLISTEEETIDFKNAFIITNNK